MLLNDLLKHTPPEHPDFASLTKALERTKQVADVMNEAKRHAESNTKVGLIMLFLGLTLLQMASLSTSLIGHPETFVLNLPGRLLVKDGSLMVSEDRKKSGSKYTYLYLFNGIQLSIPRVKRC